MLFNMVYEFVLSKIRSRLKEARLLTTITFDPDAPPWQTSSYVPDAAIVRSEHTDIADVEFVDDSVFMFDDLSPEHLINKIGTALDIVVDTFAEHGLTANPKPGKAEVMLKLI
jgi:hypothetical protein